MKMLNLITVATTCLSMLVLPSLLGASRAEASPGVDVVRHKGGCVARIARKGKRARCVACIQRGGHFHKRGGGVGFCHARPRQGVIYTKAGCATRVGRPAKRKRCMVCVHHGGAFQKMGWHRGYCNLRK